MAKTDELRQLRRVLVEFFNEDQIRALCMELGVSWDSLPGHSADAKARELVQEISQQDRVFDLLQAIYEIRPNAFWGEAKSQEAEAQLRHTLMEQWGVPNVAEGVPDIPILAPGGRGRPATDTDGSDYRALLHLSLTRIHAQLDVQGQTLGRIRLVSVSALVLGALSALGILVTMSLVLGHL